jgi:hypothetical protein
LKRLQTGDYQSNGVILSKKRNKITNLALYLIKYDLIT